MTAHWLFAAVAVAVLAGCAHTELGREKEGCCGLTGAQWHDYEKAAVSMMQSGPVLKFNGEVMPRERLVLAPNREPSGYTDSPDGVAPPNKVTIQVPLTVSYPFDVTHVIVEFQHPSKKITRIYATKVMF